MQDLTTSFFQLIGETWYLAAVAGIVALWIKGRSSKIVKLDQTKLELRGDFGPEEAEQWAQQFPSIVIDQENRLSNEKGRTK
jgi:hypothetical protein